MLGIVVLAGLHKTELLSLRGLLVCMLGSLIIWPGCFLDLSFQLVFSALFGIYLAIRVLGRFELSRPWDSLLAAILVSVFAWLSTAPVLYYSLDYFNPLQPLINLAVTPVFSALCISLGVVGILVYALSGFGLLLGLVVFLSSKLLEFLWYLQKVIS